MVINYQTTINVTFAHTDADGDVVKKFPFSLEVTKLTEAQWGEALKAILELKERVKQEVNKEETPVIT